VNLGYKSIGNLPIFILLSGGETNLYPQCEIYDSTGTLLTTLDLSHKVNGFYLFNWDISSINVGYYEAIYKIYTDVAHTTLSDLYGLVSEPILIEYASNDEMNSNLSDIQTQTNKMQFDGANNIQSRVNDKGVLNNPPSEDIDDYKADVSGLATETNATNNKNEIINEIDSIKTDNLDLRNFNTAGV